MQSLSRASLPAFLSEATLPAARSEVLRALTAQRERGLLESAKWLAELLVSLGDGPVAPMRNEEHETVALYHLGRAYVDAREYMRCYHALREARDPRCHFLASYALYMSGELRKQEELAASGPGGAKEHTHRPEGWGTNPHLWDLATRLRAVPSCAYSSYLRGVVHGHLGQDEQCVASLAAAVRGEPLLWCAWYELAKHLSTEKARDILSTLANMDMRIAALGLPTHHWVYPFFASHLLAELQCFEEAVAATDALLLACPGNAFARTQKALLAYNMRNFEASEAAFEAIWLDDPYRISDMDIYSNVLYVRGAKPKLSYLAHRVSKTDRLRPESCCIVGNYYSMRGDHNKALSYFMRALRLHPGFLSALTLMGHEYMELSNAQSAVHCYRRAVELNERDFRAWYALGQAYEILGMNEFAMWYFQKACSLRPHDARMWVALGECFDKVQRPADAIHAFERAVASNDVEGIALRSLAKLHDRQRNPERAAYFYRAHLEAMDSKGIEGPATVEALWYLAKHSASKALWKDAEGYCFRLLDFAVPEKEDAKSLLKTVHQRQQLQQQQVQVHEVSMNK